MPEDSAREREHRPTGHPQDGPAAGGSSQDQPPDERSAEQDERRVHRPSAPADSNERADGRATVIEPDGEPPPTSEDGEG